MIETPIWLSLANTAAIITLTGVLYYKLHRLRIALMEGQRIQQSMAASLEAIRSEQPPILIGETFLGERLEHIDRSQMDMLARINEIERSLGLSNGAGSA